MSKYSLLLLALLGFFAACDKSEDDDLSGDTEMNGKLYVENIFESELSKPVAGHEVFLLKDTSAAATSFFFSGRSDKDGYFSMEFLKPDAYYRLHAEMRKATAQDPNVLFTADTILQPAKRVSLVLRPDTIKQNALYLLCTDELSPAGRIPNADIYIYTSRILAELDTAAIIGAGSSYHLRSQLNGTAFKVNLPLDSLIVNAQITIGSTKLKCKAQGLKKMTPSGVVQETIILKK